MPIISVMTMLLVAVDGGDWREVIETFTWKLHTGDNRLELCTENSAGVRGPVSYAAIAVP